MKRFKDITEKLGRQLKDPKKEVMVVKKVGGKDKVITIDKSQEKDYLRKGWKLAEDIKEYGGPMVSPAEYKKMGAKMRKAGAPPVEERKHEKYDSDKVFGGKGTPEQRLKLLKLSNKALRAPARSPKQKAINKEIDALRKAMGMSVKEGASPMSEGRMKELHGYIERGMTAQQIARKMKLDVKTIQALMPSKKESVNEAVYKFLVVNTKTGEIESAGSTLDGRNGAKETKKEIERKGKKMQILQLKKKVSDKQMERMLGYTLKQSDIQVGKNATVVEALEEDAIGNFLLALNATMFGAVWLTFVVAVGQELGVIKFYDDEDELKTAKRDIARLKRKVKKYKQYEFDTSDKEKLNNALKIIRNAKPTAFQKLKTKLKDLVKKNKTIKEAVSPAQQAAIAIAKKEKGEKPKNESRAYRDAMRGLRSKSATRGMATTKKDKDTEATDDDRKAASKNIIMQLRKAADLPTGAEVEFAKGKGKVDRGTAQAALARFNALAKPRDKEKFQNSIRSLSDIKAILKRK